MCRLLTILRLESFVQTGVRDLENELFFLILYLVFLSCAGPFT